MIQINVWIHCERISFTIETARGENANFLTLPIFRASSQCAQCWRSNKRPTCVTDFEKHPPLFIETSYTGRITLPSEKRQFHPQERNLSAEPVSRKLILESLISRQHVTSISHSPLKIHESLSRSASIGIEIFLHVSLRSCIHLRFNFRMERIHRKFLQKFRNERSKENRYNSGTNFSRLRNVASQEIYVILISIVKKVASKSF